MVFYSLGEYVNDAMLNFIQPISLFQLASIQACSHSHINNFPESMIDAFERIADA